mgnify:CR=1 FL=1
MTFGLFGHHWRVGGSLDSKAEVDGHHWIVLDHSRSDVVSRASLEGVEEQVKLEEVSGLVPATFSVDRSRRARDDSITPVADQKVDDQTSK